MGRKETVFTKLDELVEAVQEDVARPRTLSP